MYIILFIPISSCYFLFFHHKNLYMVSSPLNRFWSDICHCFTMYVWIERINGIDLHEFLTSVCSLSKIGFVVRINIPPLRDSSFISSKSCFVLNAIIFAVRHVNVSFISSSSISTYIYYSLYSCMFAFSSNFSAKSLI